MRSILVYHADVETYMDAIPLRGGATRAGSNGAVRTEIVKYGNAGVGCSIKI